ncbi:uncharacterized protein ARMOST_15971 [Armillaria ostoyae]|uniref:CCHC-type domain-containing protein n=1 Tax=Armillaria ostoyae TaxID=47428 RepID=A0A284RUW7_ARMOS|nr:uncharacterized protein ARMOST_15971 [Armillaria ostoyae]
MDDKSKILFILSYMREGLAGMWAETYMDDHFDGDQFNVGTYAEFIKELDQAFLDPTLEEYANAKLKTIRQGRRPVQEFFIEFDRLRQDAGWSEDEDYVATLLPRALNNRLVEKIYYFSLPGREVPTTYQGWKERALELDARYWQGRIMSAARSDGSSSGKGTPREGSIVDGEVATSDGGMDTAEMRRRGLCFNCGKHGHLARNCRNIR